MNDETESTQPSATEPGGLSRRGFMRLCALALD
jgi:hypothetical protein